VHRTSQGCYLRWTINSVLGLVHSMKPVINLTDKASLNSEQDANSKSESKSVRLSTADNEYKLTKDKETQSDKYVYVC